MMGKNQSQNQKFEGIDEHDLPTEPGRPIMPPEYDATLPASPYSPQPSVGYPDSYQEEQPSQKIHLPAYPDAQPAPYAPYPVPQTPYPGGQYPQQQAQYPVQPYPAQPYQGQQQYQYPYPANHPQSPAKGRGGKPAEYPILPPSRDRGFGRRRKGEDSDAEQDAVPQRSPRARSGRKTGFRTSSIPGLVKFFLGLVQILLIVRLITKLLGIPASAYGWVGPVYAISDVFIQPIHQFLLHVNLPFQMPLEVYTFAAIIFYWLVSRLLVALLKALF